MAKTKRQALTFDNEQLTKDLKESTGQGMGAFFSPTPPSPPSDNTQDKPFVPQGSKKRPPKKNNKPKKEKKQKSKKEYYNITVLHSDNEAISQLRQPTDGSQSYRLTREEIKWIKKTSFVLSEEISSSAITQGDILRIAIKLFQGTLDRNKKEILKLLRKIK